jgi:hypothetical protein
MTPRRRTAVRWGLHVAALLLMVGGLALASELPGNTVAFLVGEMLLIGGLLWFVEPWLDRLRRFVQRSRRP